MKTLLVNKVKGQTLNVSEIQSQVELWLRDALNGNYLLTFERAKKPRTSEQNRLMWLWFGCIAKSWSEATGHVFTSQDVHDAYCRVFLPISTPKGVIAGSTKGLTTEQMTEFLNQVQADAATEYGITLPNPEDMYFEIWAKQYGNNF